MSVGRNLAKVSEEGGRAAGSSSRKPRVDQGVSGIVELHIDPGPLEELEPEKLKSQIVRWAKAVVAFARKLSFRGRRGMDDDLEA